MRKGNVKTNENEIIEKERPRTSKRKVVSLIITLVMFAISAATAITLGVVGILPFKYMTILTIGLAVLNILFAALLIAYRKGKKVRNIINVFQIVFILVMGIAIFYVIKTYAFINKMNEDSNVKKENYSVIVLKDSEYKKIKDLNGKVLEYYNNELDNSELALEKLKEKIEIGAVSNEDISIVGKTLLGKDVDAILIEDSQKLFLEEELEGFLENTRVLYSFAVDITVETIAKDAAVSTEPFIVYISGIDKYGKISSVSRSDVNMVAVVNPTTYQVLLVNIPRDYYVQLSGTYGKRDKLTHAGMYGVERSVKTIENLLDIDINYYFKVNFTSLVDIVDAIGGIKVYSQYSFTAVIDKAKFKEGINEMNGRQALAFARERKAFSDGDRMRGKNQQAVFAAIVEQASKPSIITKVDSLLKSLSDKFQTNMDTEKMMELVKLQISKMPKWNVSSVSLTGGDARAYAYSSGSTPLYVMLPSQNSINSVKGIIKLAMTGEILESSYKSVSGNISSLKEVEIPVVKQEEPEEVPEEPETPTETPEENESGTTIPGTGENTGSGENAGDNKEPSGEQKPESGTEETPGSGNAGETPKDDTETPKEEPEQPKEEPETPKEEPEHPKEEPETPKQEPEQPKEDNQETVNT